MSSVSMYCVLLMVVASICPSQAGHGWYYKKSRPTTAPRRAAAPSKSIAEIVVGDSRFSTLLAAVKAAGLVETLSGPGTFTVFAPTNDAFSKVPSDALNGLLADKDALTAVLLRHVLPNKIVSSAIPKGTTSVKTVGGENIDVIRNNNGVSIRSSAGSAKVILTDVGATNGVIHAVDTVF